MPWMVEKKNGKKSGDPFVYTDSEVNNLARDKENAYQLINIVTQRRMNVGGMGYGGVIKKGRKKK